MSGAADLRPGSRLPRDDGEMGDLLRRVPEVALLPEFATLVFAREQLFTDGGGDHAARIIELADFEYLTRLKEALSTLLSRAEEEDNGGVRFVATSLLHFVAFLPPERHPLIVALYFRSLGADDPAALRPEALALRMDDYDSCLR